MNDRWTDAASGIAEGAQSELAAVQAGLAALSMHSSARAALATRAADLRHRLAAAHAVLDAYAVPAGAEEAAA